MKIAFVTPYMMIGGAETYIITKSQWLIKNNKSVVIISEGGENIANIPKGCKHIAIKGLAESPSNFSRREYKRLISCICKILTEEDIDIIEVHNTFPIIHIAESYRLTKIPYIVNILSELCCDNNIMMSVSLWCIANSGICYTLNKVMHEYLEKKIKRTIKAEIIPIPINGIDEKDIKEEAYILSVSRMSNEKMYVKHLINSFMEVKKNYRLIVVGDGEYYDDIYQLAEQVNQHLGRNAIEVLGTVVGERLEYLYKRCSIFVGMGTTMLLGASCGKPCVLPGLTKKTMPYAWGYWGENPIDKDILAVNEGNTREATMYSQSLNMLILDKERRHIAGSAAKKMYKENYDIDRIMEQWVKVYENKIHKFKKGGFSILIYSIIQSVFIDIFRIIYRMYKYMVSKSRLLRGHVNNYR